MQNPYASPGALLQDLDPDRETYQPRIFALDGRIGRVRYIVYSFVMQLVATVLTAVLVVAVMPLIMSRGQGTPILPVVVLACLPMLASLLILAKRRLNDMNRSGWWSLLMLVPGVSVAVGLVLLLWPGSAGRNDYGPRPAPNPLALVLFGLVLPLLLIGLLAAIALPAYQDYMHRAQAPRLQSM